MYCATVPPQTILFMMETKWDIQESTGGCAANEVIARQPGHSQVDVAWACTLQGRSRTQLGGEETPNGQVAAWPL